MALDLRERAARYLAKAGPAISGSGGHTHTLVLARALVRGFNLSDGDAMALLMEWNEGNADRWSQRELEHKIDSARKGPVPPEGDGWLCRGAAPVGPSKYGATAPAPRSERVRPEVDMDEIARFTQGVPDGIDEAWLMRRSPVDVSSVGPGEFLDAIFRPDERVLVFTSQWSQGDFLWWVGRGGYRLSAERGVKAVRSELPKGGKDGVWFMVQPVSGAWGLNRNVRWSEDEEGRKSKDVRGRYSRRTEDNVTGWRHFLLESDVLDTAVWLRVLVALDLAIVAVYSSGGRSIHALVRYDVAAKSVWDATRKVIIEQMESKGADRMAMTAVRLSRLPGCLRGNSMQRLLFLSPNAADRQSIQLMPEVRK